MIAIVWLGYKRDFSALASMLVVFAIRQSYIAFYENRNALSLGLEVDLFRQELPKDTRTSLR